MFSTEMIAPLNPPLNARTRPEKQTDYVNDFIFWSLVIYISTLVFEGPLRFYLSKYGMGSLLYFRDLLGLTCVVLGIIKAALVNKNILDPLLITLYAIILFGTLGLLINGISLFSLAFGLKIYLVLLFGMAASESVWARQKSFEKIILLLGVLTTIGIFINAVVGKFSWEGMSYETSFGVVSTTKEWWTEGERRLAGFARASYDSAMILGMISALLLPSRGRFFSIFIGGIFFAGVYLTTSKSMIAAMAVLLMWRIFTPLKYRLTIGQLICIFFCIVMVSLPAIACMFQFDENLMRQVPRGLSSFAERLVSMWPKSCAILSTPSSWIIGGGIGSIGVPQQYMTPNNYSAADNLFLYIYVSGGMTLAAMLICTIFKGINNISMDFSEKSITIGFFIIALIYGVSINMIEQPFFSLIAGILIFKIWRNHETVQPHQANK